MYTELRLKRVRAPRYQADTSLALKSDLHNVLAFNILKKIATLLSEDRGERTIQVLVPGNIGTDVFSA